MKTASCNCPESVAEFVQEVLQPVCETVQCHKVSNFQSLRLVLALHKPATVCAHMNVKRKTDVNVKVTPPDHPKEKREDKVTLPPVNAPSHITSPKIRSLSSSSVRYPPILLSPRKPVDNEQQATPPPPSCRRRSLLFRTPSSTFDKEKHERLRSFITDIDGNIVLLQETYTKCTQRVLVPLQTFCKQNKARYEDITA